MAKIHKKKNPNRKKLSVLLILQVVFAVLPVILLAYFIFQMRNTQTYVFAYICIAAMILCGSAYFILARQYNILLSGIRGERSMLKTARKLDNNYTVFVNLPVRYKRNRSEIDMLVICEKGLLVVEVKNHSGVITGNDSDEFWHQYKHFRDGKITTAEIQNPIRQVNRQREILKNILKSNGIDVWIYSAVYYSNPFVKLDLSLKETSIVVHDEHELLKLINESRTEQQLQPDVLAKITDIVTNIEI